MPVAFDSTMLSTLLHPHSNVPDDPQTGKPVEWPKERVQGLIIQLARNKQKIIIPAPVTAEILTVIGPANTEYLSIINRSRVFEVVPLDDKAAVELAFLNRDTFAKRDKKSKAKPYQKVKVDRQILAICKVSNCDTLYTDDNSLIGCAQLCGIKAVRLCEVPIPDSARQHQFDLEPHDELPELEDDLEDSGDNTPKP